MQNTINASTRELLTWVASRERSYSEAMEAWRTHCPRLAVWDDAVTDGLVRARGGSVVLTPRGRTLLDQA